MLTLKERDRVHAADLTVKVVVTEYEGMAPGARVTGGRSWILSGLGIVWHLEKGIARCTFVRGHHLSISSATDPMTPRVPSISGAICDVVISVRYHEAIEVYAQARTKLGSTWEPKPFELANGRGVRDMNRSAEMIIVGKADLTRLKERVKQTRTNPPIEDCVSVQILGDRPAPDLSQCTAAERQCALGEAPYKFPPTDYIISDLVVNVDAAHLIRAHRRYMYERKLAIPINIKNQRRLEDRLSSAARRKVGQRTAPSRRVG